jgi:hypothetical protein
MSPAATLTTITAATLASGVRGNQDHVVITDHAVAVLDGATSWLPQNPRRDGGWYSRQLGAELTTHLTDDSQPLAALVANTIESVRDRFGLMPGDCPTSTVTALRWSSDSAEVYTLGDSPAVIYPTNSSPRVIYDDRLESVGSAERTAYREHLRSGRGYDAELRQMIANLQLEERRQRNCSQGYWIAENNPLAASHGVTADLPIGNVAAALLLSDGASAAVTDYGLYTWASLAETLFALGMDATLRLIHEAEAMDSDGVRWPRAKRHDDKTVVSVRFRQGSGQL